MSTETMIRSLYEAFNSRNFDAGAALIANNAQWLDMATGQSFQGPEGYKQFVQGWSGAFPDSRVVLSKVAVADGNAVVEFRGQGTHTGPLQTPAGPIPPTGKSVDIPFCEVLQIENGRVTSAHTYFDSATMLRQLGLV
ncbi:MAG: ester cyclase [Chloroflexi bacterium]|nr:ester cyclase [Chloroflexota bacterium]MCI0579897.1 ester cyclase [Chloroflexota bacterium]MCI0646178.1 ester cyclase [Chloroflexota bacterium]MCI0729888.1 ester cyclase [Chloroflexota bacterium]